MGESRLNLTDLYSDASLRSWLTRPYLYQNFGRCKLSLPFSELLVHDLSPKFAVLGNVDPGLRRGREAPPEGPDSTELVREVVPVVAGHVNVGVGDVVVVVEVGVEFVVGVAVGVVGVTNADLLGHGV